MRKYRIFLVVLLLIVLGILGYHNREFLFEKGGDTDVETQADSLPVVSSEGETECMVCPSGEPVGIYVKTKGVMVIGVNSVVDEQGITCNPCENLLSPGDYVMRINGQSVDDKKSMLELVQQSEGHELLLRVCRENEYRTVRVTPVKKKDGSYALGLWVKDDISGRLEGIINYTGRYVIGRVEENSAFGIHGYLTKRQQKTHTQDIQVAVGRKSEVHVGTAYLLSSVSGESKQYEIEIVSVDSDNENGRCMEFKVTDSTLLSLTGGIVQGMSGTPILQDGRLIGAVTHVFVNDSTRGYGIFIEEMMQ